MKSTFFIISVVAFVLAGCSHQDPIDSIVKKASADPIFPVSDTISVLIKLPATAPVADVVAKALEGRGPEGRNVTILETRPVHIANANKMNKVPADANDYTAVLVNTSSGRKVILLQFFPRVGLWNYVIYDLPPAA